MKTSLTVRHIRHGDLIAEIDIQLNVYASKSWSPTLDLETIRKIERVRKALESGDLDQVRSEARLYRLESA